MEIEGATMDGTGTAATVCCETVVDGEMGLDALKGIHVRSPFDECETIEHG
jgi:hypothetical protein